MSAPHPTDVQALLAEVAGEHYLIPDYTAVRQWGEGFCFCDATFTGLHWQDVGERHAAHVAAVLAAALVPWVAQQRVEALRGALDIVDDYERVLSEFDAKVAAGPEHPVHARGEGAHRAAEIIHQRITEALHRIEHPEWFTGGDDDD